MSLQLISVVSALETMKLRVSNGLNKHKSKVFGAHGVDLVEYLGNVHNYNRFALYLSNCYALENLRFLEAIIIFHNALRTCLGRKKTRRKYPQLSLNRLFSLKFKYLSKLNKEYIRKIEGGSSDTYIVKETFDAALVSAGLVIEATKHVFSHIPPLPFPQEIKDAMDVDDNADAHNNDNTNKPVLQTETTEVIDETSTKKYAVVLNRPPGHHCDGEKYSGYCFINSTAVAIEKQLNEDTRVLVLDIDVHHGDGTQKLFYTEPTVLAVSFHQYDGSFFPVSGLRTEYGPSRRHAAYGTNVNVPLGHGASDLDVLYALRSMVWNIVEKFKPDIAFYAVGTDGVAGDKANAATIFTPSLYGQVAYELRKYVDLIVVTTEGGYTTDYLSSGMSAVLHGLTGQIDTEYYPSELNENDILATTVHTVAATTSDLRRVYDFEQDPHEISKIFNKGGRLSQSVEANGESMYCPNDEDEQDGDYMQNETYFDDEEDDEFFKELTKQRKNEKHKEKEKEKK